MFEQVCTDIYTFKKKIYIYIYISIYLPTKIFSCKSKTDDKGIK